MRTLDLTVSYGPHRHCGSRISRFSYDFFIALAPAALLGIYHYGFDALRVIATSVSSAMIIEALVQKLLRRPVSIADGSAAVSGLLLALILPATVPWYVILVANAVGIAVVKQCFGGLGANILNPALAGWAVIQVTKTWAGFLDFDLTLINYDLGFPIAYPLAVLKAKGAGALVAFPLWDLLLGRQTGGIGASGVLLLLIGGLYLVLRGTIRWQIPLFFIVGLAILSGIFWASNPATYANPLFHLFAGNAMIGAFFLSTDHASSPVNRWGMFIYGLGCGLMTGILRVWSVYSDGVVFAILLMSLFTPLVDKLRAKPTEPVRRPFGTGNSIKGTAS
jgi:electron transport complex protein RnfD